jgi:hypothetical protein
MVVGTQLPLGAGPRTFGLPRWVISGSAVNGDTRPVQSKTHAAEAQTNSCATSNQAVTVSPRANAIPQVPFGETHCAGRPVPPSLIPSSRNRFIAQSWHCVDGKARASGGGFRGLGCAKAPVAGPLPGMDPRELRGHTHRRPSGRLHRSRFRGAQGPRASRAGQLECRRRPHAQNCTLGGPPCAGARAPTRALRTSSTG